MSDTPSIDIRPDHWLIVQSVLHRHVPQHEVWAFGSRAKWTAKEYSDLDLVVITDKPLSLDVIAGLSDDFSESDLPYKVDVVDWATTNESFKKIIERDRVVVKKVGRSSGEVSEVKWFEKSLGEVTINHDGKRRPVKESERKMGPYVYYGASGAIDYIDGYLFEGRYLLIAEDGENLRTRKTPIAFIADGKFWVNNHVHTVTGNGEVTTEYLHYYLQCADIQSYLTGAVMPKLTQGNLNKIPVRYPELNYQKSIVCVLSALDEKIDLNRRINLTLEAMAQAIFKSWFVDFDPVKAKIAAKHEGRDPLRAAMRAISGKAEAELDALPLEQYQQLAATAALFPDEMEKSELGEIPRGWGAGVFKECCLRVESGGTPSRKEPAFWDGSIPWLTSGEVREVVVLDTREKITCAGLASSSAKLWPAMTTVVAMYGATAGQVCLLAEEMTANQACCALIPKSEFRAFVFIAARQSIQQLLEKASGSAQQNLNKSLVENHAQVIPDRDVAEAFEMVTTKLLQKWILNQRSMVTLGALRDTLLPKLLSGELSVSAATAGGEA